MTQLSLRARVLLGAALWTLGLFAIAGVMMTLALVYHPEVPVAVHAVFGHPRTVLALAVLAMAFGLLQVRRGLSPVHQLRSRLADVHRGRAARIEGAYPAEVQPLVDDLNALLDERERRVARAIAKAADLAHGLKTPLAVLTHEARQVHTLGDAAAASAIAEQVERMRRQIDYHLAHARSAASAASPSARASVHESAAGLVRALQRLHADRRLTIAADVPVDHVFRGQPEDLEEMLGNLLDNACRWARGRVALSSSRDQERLTIDVDDDGPGIEASQRETMLQRSARADETGPGTGLGLAIARDLAEIYGGRITLTSSPLGGLRARLELPAAHG